MIHTSVETAAPDMPTGQANRDPALPSGLRRAQATGQARTERLIPLQKRRHTAQFRPEPELAGRGDGLRCRVWPRVSRELPDWLGVPIPELHRRVRPHHPLAISRMQMDRHSPKRAAPLHHRSRSPRRRPGPSVHRPWRRRSGRGSPTARCRPACAQGSRAARCRTVGWSQRSQVPVARRRNLLLCVLRNPSRVVQDWPEAGTNWRSSVPIRTRIGRCLGGRILRAAGCAEEGWHDLLV